MFYFQTPSRPRCITRTSLSKHAGMVCLVLIVLSATSRRAPCQVTDEPDDRPAVVVEEEEAQARIADEEPRGDEGLPFPIVPGTTVVGRPDPFPTSPLGEGTVESILTGVDTRPTSLTQSVALHVVPTPFQFDTQLSVS